MKTRPKGWDKIKSSVFRRRWGFLNADFANCFCSQLQNVASSELFQQSFWPVGILGHDACDEAGGRRFAAGDDDDHQQ